MFRQFLDRLLGGGDTPSGGYAGTASSVPEIDAATGGLAIAAVFAALLLARHVMRRT